MKRRDFEDISRNFSSPSRKSRRLDGELLPFMQEDPTAFDEGGSSLDPTAASSSLVQADGSATYVVPSVNSSEQMAMVLYCPHTTPFLTSPSSPELPIVVNSGLIPGIKDHIFWPKSSTTVKLMEDELAASKGREHSDDSLALVPWVASPVNGQTGSPEPMEAEEVEMMDVDDTGTGINEWKACEKYLMAEGDGLQQWQQQKQHCMASHFLQNKYSPVTW